MSSRNTQLVADTNGVVRVRIEHLAVKINPDVIGQTGAAQRGLIESTGAVAAGITAATGRPSRRRALPAVAVLNIWLTGCSREVESQSSSSLL